MEFTRISSPQATQALHSARARQGAGGAGDGDGESPGGFLALLDVEVRGETVSDLAGSTASNASTGTHSLIADSEAKPEGVDASLVAPWQGLFAPVSQGLGSVALASTPQSELSGVADTHLSADVFLSAAGLPGRDLEALREGAHWVGTMNLVDVREGLVAETAVLDGAADLETPGLPATTSGYGLPSNTQNTGAQRLGNGARAALQDAMAGRAALGRTLPHPAMAAPSGSNTLHGIGENPAALTGQPPMAHLERAGGPAPVAFASNSLLLAEGGLMGASRGARGDAPGARSGDSQAGAGAWFDGAAGSGPPETNGVGGSSAFADPSQASAEEFVTDQVAFWVNQKTQTAELTLDRAGQPVEVSVSLSGNEAHVTFRSDESQTRELLDRSMAQLSDLLQNEGLVLSGMSVGTSARDGADTRGSGQPRNRDGATRQAQVVVSAPMGTPAAQRTASGRTVDIFV